MALNPVKPLYSASATATNGSAIITVTGNVNCSFLSSGSIVSLGTRQLADAISGTAPDGSGNSTITLRRPWADPTTTGPLLAFMSYEGLADAVVRLRQIIDASEGSLEGAFSFLGTWDPTAGDFPPIPGESLGSQMYRVDPAGTMGGRLYRAGEPIYYDQFTSQWRSFFELASAFTTGLLANTDAATWRTALGLVPTASPTDTTAGRLLQVGDGGINYTYSDEGLKRPESSGSLSGMSALGFSRYVETDAGRPPYGSGYGAVLNIPILRADGLNYGCQLALDYATEELQIRRLFGTFAEWVRVYHNKNILGTVSQSGGVPTGAIIQRGSNVNGEFTRFADGSIYCSVRATFVAGSNGTIWNYPSIMSATPSVQGSPAGGSANSVIVSIGSATNANVVFSVIISSTGLYITSNYRVDLTAYGSWFNL